MKIVKETGHPHMKEEQVSHPASAGHDVPPHLRGLFSKPAVCLENGIEEGPPRIPFSLLNDLVQPGSLNLLARNGPSTTSVSLLDELFYT